MRTTDIGTREKDLVISYGLINFMDEPRELALASVKYLYTDLTDIRKYYIRLGFHLDEFRRMDYCHDFGYSNIFDFCERNLGLDKSTVSRCINVYKEFNASSDSTYKCGVYGTGSAMELSEEYKDYSYTQLCEMLSLTPEQRKEITPDMSVRKIRDYKKSLKTKNRKADDPVASTQQKDVVFYDPDEYLEKSGFMRCNYVRKCSSLASGTRNSLNIFDSRGKKVLMDAECDVLMNADGEIVLRLSAPYDTAEPVKNLICI